MKKDVITFGCRLNSFESEIIKQNLDAVQEEHVAVFNTCTVTKEAERQARQSIRRYKRENPDAKIIVTGCSAQVNPAQYDAMDEVDTVLGNSEKLERSSFENAFTPHIEKVRVNDIMSVTETANHLISGFEGRARAFMEVQNGCNHRCTFCIIPYGRGNSRSAPMGELVKQGNHLVEQGYNEIVFTGVDITSYGHDLPGEPTLGQMMKRFLANVPDLKRLRLSSIDVAEIDEDMLDLIANEPRLMPHLHLSLQAGDDMILKRMKRRHTRQQIIDFAAQARGLRPDIAFGADIIAGFPTETDAMFENTLRIVEEANLTWLHIFPYSEREGTPAAAIPANKQVPVPLRKERAERLRQAGNEQVNAFLQSRIGKTENIVVEKNGMGRTAHFAMAKVAEDLQEGSIIEATVVASEGNALTLAA